MHYMTRHLVAARDLPLGDRLVVAGEAFFATDIDADYLVGQGHASEGGDTAVLAAPVARPVVTAAPADVPAAGDTFNAAAEPMALSAADLAAPAAETPATPTRRPYTRRTPAKVEGS